MRTLGFKRPRLHRLSLVALAAMLAACLLAVVIRLEPSQAAFPGQNGKIAFTSYRDDKYAIYTMNADGSNQTKISITEGADPNPAWSPDGKKIAFGKSGEIYTMNADGSDLTNISTTLAFEDSPAWSPDGRKIAFTSFRSGKSAIGTMNADGSNRTNISSSAGGDHSPDWSPDGTKIAFTSFRDGNDEVYTMNADGSNQTNISNNVDSDGSPDWSPDGTKIAFTSFRDNPGEGNGEIYTMNADGSGQTNLTNHIDFDYNPAFSPDGTKIAFTTYRDSSVGGLYYEVYTMNADGSNQINISNNPGLDAADDWQPLPTNTAPTITGLRPPPGSSTTDRTPTVAATVKDQHTDLAKSNIALLVDDATIPRSAYSYNPSTDMVSYTPEKKLSLGKHTVKVTTRDGSGLSTTKRWSFEVVHP